MTTKVHYRMIEGTEANIVDFGEIGVGNDTAVMQAMLDSGASVGIVSENVIITSPVTVPSSFELIIRDGVEVNLDEAGKFISNIGSFNIKGLIVNDGTVVEYGTDPSNTVTGVSLDVEVLKKGSSTVQDEDLFVFYNCKAKNCDIKVRAIDNPALPSNSDIAVVKVFQSTDNACERWKVNIFTSGYGLAWWSTQNTGETNGYGRDMEFDITGINCTGKGFSNYHTRRSKIKYLYLYGNDEPAYIWMGTEGRCDYAEFTNAAVGAHIEQLETVANVSTNGCNTGVVLTWGNKGVLNIQDTNSGTPVEVNALGNILATSDNYYRINIDHFSESATTTNNGVRIIQDVPANHPIKSVHVTGRIKGGGKGIYATQLLPNTEIVSEVYIDTANTSIDVRTDDIADPITFRQLGGRLTGSIRTDCSGTSSTSVYNASLDDYTTNYQFWDDFRPANVMLNCFDEATSTLVGNG